MKATGNTRPGLRVSLQSKRTILVPSPWRRACRPCAICRWGVEKRVVILWQPSTFSHELLCEVPRIVDASGHTIYRIAYIKLTKKTFGERPLTSAQINLEAVFPMSENCCMFQFVDVF